MHAESLCLHHLKRTLSILHYDYSLRAERNYFTPFPIQYNYIRIKKIHTTTPHREKEDAERAEHAEAPFRLHPFSALPEV